MEMPATDQQGCGQSILSLGLSVWRDQLNHVVAHVRTFHSFVGMSLFKTKLKQRPYRRTRNVALEEWRLLQFAVGANDHLVDTNYQILQITV